MEGGKCRDKVIFKFLIAQRALILFSINQETAILNKWQVFEKVKKKKKLREEAHFANQVTQLSHMHYQWHMMERKWNMGRTLEMQVHHWLIWGFELQICHIIYQVNVLSLNRETSQVDNCTFLFFFSYLYIYIHISNLCYSSFSLFNLAADISQRMANVLLHLTAISRA